MVSTLVVAVLLGASPAQSFSARFPGSAVVRSADGQRVVHASGFRAEPGARDAEGAARAFLGAHAAAFGITSRQSLALAGTPARQGVRAVRFHRTIDGLPVFGGDLVVGVDRATRVYLVNGADVPPVASGHHAVGEEAARAAATAALGGRARVVKVGSVVAGWSRSAADLRAVYRVDLVVARPAGEWRVLVDGETGRVLFREDRRRRVTAAGRAYQVSPTETAASACPLSGGTRTYCASPVDVTLANLTTGEDLTGSQTTVYACNGLDAPSTVADGRGVCSTVPAVNGAFAFAYDASYRSTSDAFAAANAYYHLDRHLSFLRSLDATPPDGGGSHRALTGSLPAFVNAYDGGEPLDNAYYSSDLDGIVFGQGAGDFAYDATVLYHELTHAAIEAWGDFPSQLDALGGLDEPGALHEATADAMAVSEIGRSEIGSFAAAIVGTGTRCLRDVSDPYAMRTCKGHGNSVYQFGMDIPAIDGLDGEVHDDGEIWNGFFWEIYRGLEAAGVRGCDGTCAAAPALQYAAIQLAGGTSPTFASYAQTFGAAAAALFPDRPEVAAFVGCVARRRELDQCDRTVPVYSGELKATYTRLPYAPYQIVLQTTGPAQYATCSGRATSTTLHLRNGSPVQVGTAGVVAESVSPKLVPGCNTPQTWFSIPSAGTWYLLFDWPDAVRDTIGYDVYLLQAAAYGVKPRPSSSAPELCAPPFAQALAIAPETATVAPGGSLAFTASGGTGSGYVWALGSNRSGASIDAAGQYRAGATGGVTDVVKVTDSYGDVATRNVAVTGAGVVPQRGHGGCATEGGGLLAALGVAAAAARGARRRRADG